jgi:hypothetical protein
VWIRSVRDFCGSVVSGKTRRSLLPFTGNFPLPLVEERTGNFQFVLTNFSIAADISAGVNPFETETESLGKTIRTIETRIGGWTVFTINTALFIACFLAVKLALIRDAELGAILAIVRCRSRHRHQTLNPQSLNNKK